MRRLCLLLAVAFAPAAGAAFKCVDERGFTHVGDTPPAGCAAVVMYEITKAGKVIRRIDPTLTPEQAKAKAEAEERRKEADKLAAEQRRKDMALLATYSSDAEFDVVRDRTIAPIDGRIVHARKRLEEIDKRNAALEDELEFYKAGKSKSAKKVEAPPSLVAEKERLAAEKKSLVRNIAASEKEIAELRSKFDHDKQRWLAIKSGAVARPEPEARPEPKPEPRPVRKSY